MEIPTDNLTVEETKITNLWKEIRDFFIYAKEGFDSQKLEYKFAEVSAASVTTTFSISEMWSALNGAATTESIDSSVVGDLPQLALGVNKYRITSTFRLRKAPKAGASRVHKGVDIAVPTGTSLYAPFNGKIVLASYMNKAGNTVVIESDNGHERVTYMHLSGTPIPRGTKVTKGQYVASSGNTGVSTGPHLHLAYQVKSGGKWVYKDPLKAYRNNKNFSTVKTKSYGSTKLKNLGEKINNPLSLTDANIPWEGKVGTYTAGTGVKFVKFDTPFSGVRAGMLNIRNKANRVRTINDFVSMYVTGAHGNDEAKYIQDLSRALGVNPRERIDLSDETTLKALTAEVAKLESGSIIGDSMLNQAYKSVNSYISSKKVNVKGVSAYNKQ